MVTRLQRQFRDAAMFLRGQDNVQINALTEKANDFLKAVLGIPA
jgi:hypothetical protein